MLPYSVRTPVSGYLVIEKILFAIFSLFAVRTRDANVNSAVLLFRRI